MADPFKYDIAVSFASEDRRYVDAVVQRVKDAGYKVFYDRDEEVNLWGGTLTETFAEIYGKDARFVVIFGSRHYAEKSWTNFERRHAIEGALNRPGSLLPIRLDDTQLRGIGSTLGFIDGREYGPDEIAERICSKLASVKAEQEARGGDVPSPPAVEAPQPRQKRLWRKWPRQRPLTVAAEIAAVVAAVATVATLLVQYTPIGDEKPPDDGGTGSSEDPTGSPPATLADPSVDYVWNNDCARWYSNEPVEQIEPAEAKETVLSDEDPVMAEEVWLDISVQNRDGGELKLTDIAIEEIERNNTPQTGALLRTAVGCAEGIAQWELIASLDEDPPPIAPFTPETESGDTVDRITMPYTVSTEGPDTFRLYFVSNGCDCRFRVVLYWEYDGKPTVPTRLPGNGERFHVVPHGDLSSYRLEETADGETVFVTED